MSQNEIDITADVCPFTFVKTKLLVERMGVGETALVRLKGREPLKNVPRSLIEHGHAVLSVDPEVGEGPDGVHRLVLKKLV
ncbi:sulfurtransferase TusA family protein [Rhodospira trueperi]|uniref:TusA-related sulfurtransferase n=1 Tax=Rhodospira trueperi TaxID=69960 RepID=A0A1G7EC19_9PROT|nr:sulfurtransferase TusA family protein [Rhodospira trueperi]SDE61231.1 TusA-related sulfurtransferase [Rhodospira trueperi]